MLERLEPGDVLMVTRLDRLARSTRDLLNILDTHHQGRRGSSRSPIPGPTPRRRTAA